MTLFLYYLYDHVSEEVLENSSDSNFSNFEDIENLNYVLKNGQKVWQS